MQIGCTGTLQKYIKREIGTADASVDPFYTWSANLLTMNRRKVIAVANDDNRCGFVLYGMKASDLGKLEQMLQEGMRRMLSALHIAPELAERYMHDCGAEIVYTKTKDRSTAARLNGFCSRMKRVADYCFMPDDRYQDAALRQINNDVFKQSGRSEYIYTLEALRQGFERNYPGEPIFQCEMARLKISLLNTDCSRVVLVPLDISLRDLHRVIQACFSWTDTHLHEFTLKTGARTWLDLFDAFPQYEKMADESLFGELDSTSIEQYISLAEALQKCRVLQYEYDFGDGWEHEIRCMGKAVETGNLHACCIAAMGEAPPEDCGGPFGFARLKEVLQNPDDEEYEEITEWLGSTQLEPVNVDMINHLLKIII